VVCSGLFLEAPGQIEDSSLIGKEKGHNTASEGTWIEGDKTADEETESKVVLVVFWVIAIQSERCFN